MDGVHEYVKYQMMQRRGVQKRVQVSADEEGLPCIYLGSVERVFPSTIAISSNGVRIPFAKGSSNIQYVRHRATDRNDVRMQLSKAHATS